MIGLCETLRSLRMAANLSQTQMGLKMGVHRNTVLRMEILPNVAAKHLYAAANALNINASSIIRHCEKHAPQSVQSVDAA